MPENITTYKVFLASPNHLAPEIQICTQELIQFNSHPRVKFTPVHWKDLGFGQGNPEEQILPYLEACDYLVLLLWDRWGQAPGGCSDYSSGTEAEFFHALKCSADPNKSMRDIGIFFKSINNCRRVDDAGPQLARVKGFREQLDIQKTLFYREFQDGADLRKLFGQLLQKWSCEAHTPKRAGEFASLPFERDVAGEFDVDLAQCSKKGCRDLLKLAQSLERQKRFVQAEIALARASIEFAEELDAQIDYGRFKRSRGKLSEAEGIFRAILERARREGDRKREARGHENLGKVLRRRDRLEEAAREFEQARELYQKVGDKQGMINQLAQLGWVYRWQGDLAGAEAAHQQALDAWSYSADRFGIGSQRGALGLIYLEQRNLDKAEEYLRQSLQDETNLNRKRHMAKVTSHLTRLYLLKGDLDLAIRYNNESRKLNEEVGVEEGLAYCEFNQACIVEKQDKPEFAKILFASARERFERIGMKRDEQEADQRMQEVDRLCNELRAKALAH